MDRDLSLWCELYVIMDMSNADAREEKRNRKQNNMAVAMEGEGEKGMREAIVFVF